MQADQTGQAAVSAAPAYVIRYTHSFEAALEAGRSFQARLIRWYYVAFGAGLPVGAVVAVQDLSVGLTIMFFCALMVLTTRFAVMDRLFGRRRFRSVLGRSIQLTIGEDGIIWDGPQATSHIPWTSLTEIRANSRTVLFVRDRLPLAYAPTDSFATPGEQAEIVAYSRRHIAAARATEGKSVE